MKARSKNTHSSTHSRKFALSLVTSLALASLAMTANAGHHEKGEMAAEAVEKAHEKMPDKKAKELKPVAIGAEDAEMKAKIKAAEDKANMKKPTGGEVGEAIEDAIEKPTPETLTE